MSALLPMLADIATQGGPVDTMVAVLGGGGLGYVLKSVMNVKVGPQPFEVKKVADFATKKELAELRRDVTHELQAIDGRIDGISPTLGELKGKLDGVEKTNRQILDILLKK